MLPKRAQLSQLSEQWDLLVIGGGITGAGVALVAAQQGLKVLLVEQKDYAWGTSSRSSKMVHGGLRYLSQGAIGLTRESLRERELYIRELPHLVKRMPYYFPLTKGQFPGPWAMGAALWLYDKLARVNERRWHTREELVNKWPAYAQPNLLGAYSYSDALTDDSRLVMRVLQEASANGAEIINYVAATNIEAGQDHSLISLQDQITKETRQIKAQRVINATGAWADELSATDKKIRPLRGSHLIFSTELLPISACLTLLHPKDKRPVFVFPWQGRIVVGTTDQDHAAALGEEAKASSEEVNYLLSALHHAFPNISIAQKDIYSTQAGVRPVISSGTGKDPSKERRDHLVWSAPGRINVSGGKLTTFRVIALDALKAAGFINQATYKKLYRQRQLFTHKITWPNGLGDPLGQLPTEEQLKQWWRWAVRHEQVMHLDDLLLRRTHVGNLYPDGGQTLLENNAHWLQQELGWSPEHWQNECRRYQKIWQTYYQPQE